MKFRCAGTFQFLPSLTLCIEPRRPSSPHRCRRVKTWYSMQGRTASPLWSCLLIAAAAAALEGRAPSLDPSAGVNERPCLLCHILSLPDAFAPKLLGHRRWYRALPTCPWTNTIHACRPYYVAVIRFLDPRWIKQRFESRNRDGERERKRRTLPVVRGLAFKELVSQLYPIPVYNSSIFFRH